jgi:hypothetical protein
MSYIIEISQNGNNIFKYDQTMEYPDNMIPLTPQEKDYFSLFVNDPESIATTLNDLNASLASCFPDTPIVFTDFSQLTTIPNQLYYLALTLDNTNIPRLVFSFQVTYYTETLRAEIYNVCKYAGNIEANRFSVSNFLKFINNVLFYGQGGLETSWLAVLFSNPNYERAVKAYLRAGFEIKYVSDFGALRADLNGRFLVMEAYKGKRAYNRANPEILTEAQLQAQTVVANNIRSLEYTGLDVSTIKILPNAWKILLNKVITEDKECGGIINKKTDSTGSFYIDKFGIIMGCEGGEFGEELECTTAQVLPYEINFHTHPLYCINKLFSRAILTPPSVPDCNLILHQSMKWLQFFHIVVSMEGLYIINVHPYWRHVLSNEPRDSHCFVSLQELINKSLSEEDMMKTDNYRLDLIDTLKFMNNKLSPNLLIKRFKRLHGDNASVDEFKQLCIMNDLNRNINLFTCSFIPYPFNIDTTHGFSILQYIELLRINKLEMEKYTLDDRKKIVDEYINTTFFDVPMELPYFTANPGANFWYGKQVAGNKSINKSKSDKKSKSKTDKKTVKKTK